MVKVVLLLADGFEEIEATATVDILRRGGVDVDVAGINGNMLNGANNVMIVPDLLLDDLNEDAYDMVILPGGHDGMENLKSNEKVIKILKKFNKDGKHIAAICASPTILEFAGITKGKNLTSYPAYREEFKRANYVEDLVVTDGNITTSRGPATTPAFAFELLNVLGKQDDVKQLREGMLYNLL